MLQPTDNVTIQGKSDIYKLCFLCSWMVNKKRKIPSKLSLMNCLSNLYKSDKKYINLLKSSRFDDLLAISHEVGSRWQE